MQTPFHIQPSLRSFPRQVSLIGGSKGAVYMSGQERRRDQDSSEVGLHSSKPSWELWGLNQRRGEERGSSPALSALQTDLKVSVDICTTSHWPIPHQGWTELPITGCHPPRSLNRSHTSLPWEPKGLDACFANIYVQKCSPKIGGPCQVGQNRGGGLLPVNCVSGGEAV